MKLLFFITLMISMTFTENNPNQKVSFSVDPVHLKEQVQRIVATPTPRCFDDTASLNMVAEYISSRFESLGYAPTEQSFIVGGKTYKNICATIGPPRTKRIVIGAHYDVAGFQDGADDNASGVAGMLELARIAKENEKALKKQVEFVAFSLEEPPNFGTESMGSYIHAKSLFDAKVEVEVMICLEMIGYFTDDPKSQQFPVGIMKLFYPTTGNFIAAVGTYGSGNYIRRIKNIFNKKTNLPCFSLIAPKIIPGVDFSDHRNYWKFNYKAFMITDTAFNRNKAYHTEDDTIEKLDFTRMAEVVKGVAFFMVQ